MQFCTSGFAYRAISNIVRQLENITEKMVLNKILV